jgi:deoxycytidylate deaminase
MNTRRMFYLAKNISKLSSHPKHRMGAVIVDKGTPISVGCNQCKSHPLAKWNGLHAEVQAIHTSGKNRIRGSSVFIYRERKSGLPAMARPCCDCMNALREFGVRWVYYTTNDFPFWDVERL